VRSGAAGSREVMRGASFVWLLVTVPSAVAAAVVSRTALPHRKPAWFCRRTPAVQACICINCKFVDRCKTYHWVETQHEQQHVTDAPDFEPNDPQIQVFIRDEDAVSKDMSTSDGSDRQSRPALTTEFDVFECDAFVEDAGHWLRLMPDADFIPT
jgi:hypothetical protein